jgi:hypothetical protein
MTYSSLQARGNLRKGRAHIASTLGTLDPDPLVIQTRKTCRGLCKMDNLGADARGCALFRTPILMDIYS